MGSRENEYFQAKIIQSEGRNLTALISKFLCGSRNDFHKRHTCEFIRNTIDFFNSESETRIFQKGDYYGLYQRTVASYETRRFAKNVQKNWHQS